MVLCCISERAALIYIFCYLPYIEWPRTITQIFLPPLHIIFRHRYYDFPTSLHKGSLHPNYVRSAGITMSTTTTYTTHPRTLMLGGCTQKIFSFLHGLSVYPTPSHARRSSPSIFFFFSSRQKCEIASPLLSPILFTKNSMPYTL